MNKRSQDGGGSPEGSRSHTLWSALVAGVAITSLAALPLSATAQRWGGDHGKGDSDSHSSGAPHGGGFSGGSHGGFSGGRSESYSPRGGSFGSGSRDSFGGRSSYTPGNRGGSFGGFQSGARDSAPSYHGGFSGGLQGGVRDTSPSYHSPAPSYRDPGAGYRSGSSFQRDTSGSVGSGSRWSYTPRDSGSSGYRSRFGQGSQSSSGRFGGDYYDRLNRAGVETHGRDPGITPNNPFRGGGAAPGAAPSGPRNGGFSASSPFRPGAPAVSSSPNSYSRRDPGLQNPFRQGGPQIAQGPGSFHGKDNRFTNHNFARDRFTSGLDGGHFHNGVFLRPAHVVNNYYLTPYFPGGYCFYPYYAPHHSSVSVFFSLYGFYGGWCPSYIYRDHCFWGPPSTVFIDVPVYVGDECRGYYGDDYYLNHPYEGQDPEVDTAISALVDGFRGGNIQALVDLTDPNVRIAVFLKGRYEYSLAPNDYLDMTRDMLRNTDTIQFELYRVHRRAAGVYVISGKHVYRDPDGRTRTVYVSYVLERINGRLTLTQVGTAPDHIQEW